MNTSKSKLNKIAEVWNNFILEYTFCSNKINFNEEAKTNYFGEILHCFSDTFDIIFTKRKMPKGITQRFSFTISFLQAIYIQQDLTVEMLKIFGIELEKDELNRNPSYSINRAIRNELIGHPIRKTRKDVLISSALQAAFPNDDSIHYGIYHKDTGFQLELKSYPIREIRQRHGEFLDTYFNKIFAALKTILKEYIQKLIAIEHAIDTQNFESVLQLIEEYFEAFLKSHEAYDRLALTRIYSMRATHLRYSNFINIFYHDLKSSLSDTKECINSILHPPTQKKAYSRKPKVEIILVERHTNSSETSTRKNNFQYELGKLATKRNERDFAFFASILKAKFADNDLITGELRHMENNISNAMEYYSSLKLLRKHLLPENSSY